MGPADRAREGVTGRAVLAMAAVALIALAVVVPHPTGLLVLGAAKAVAGFTLLRTAAGRAAGTPSATPLRLIAASMLVGAVVNLAQHSGPEDGPVVSVGSVVAYVLVMGGLWLIARRRSTQLPADARIDALVITSVLALVVWHVELHEVAEGGGVGELLLSVGTLALGWQGLRIALDGGEQTVARQLVVACVAAFVVGDLVWYGVGWTPVSRGLYATCYVMLALAARTTSMATIADPLPSRRSTLARGRLALLTGVVVAGSLAVAVVPSSDVDGGPVVVLRVVLVGCLLLRAYLLAGDRDSAVEAHRSSLAAMEHQTTHDQVTGLANRQALLVTLTALGRLAAAERTGVAVAVVDIDGFHVVNRTMGHDAADMLLAQVGEALSVLQREGQVVGRWGGDVFVVADLAADRAAAARLSHRAAEVARVGREDGGQHTAGVGVAWAAAPIDVDTLVGQAEAAMVEAKRQGPGGVAGPDDTLHHRVLAREDLEQAVVQALEDRELSVHYQPVVRLSDGEVIGCEALVRWHRTGVGMVPPDLLVGLAEQIGAIHALGRQVLEQVCADALQLPAHTSVAVNVSPLELARAGYAETLVEVVRAGHGLTLDRLVLEVTEQALVAPTDDQTLTTNLRGLHAAGVRIAVDDFGTGWSGLARLRDLPVSVLKIDRSFVAGMLLDPSDRAIIAATLRLARDLALETVAEGVETPEQAMALHDLGCDLAQGWNYGAAQPPERLGTRDHSPR